jgi:hypothetical protein
VFSGLGSGAAWLASYSRADDRIRKLRSLEILLDMAKAGRAAETSDALDALSDEIDDILRRTMQQVERNELDAAALFAFSVVLNQARAEISERRAQLRAPAAVAAAPLASAEVTQLRVAAGE